MPFNVLLLPLLGGYVFLTQFNWTRFWARRLSGNNLVVQASLVGCVLLGLAYAITYTLTVKYPGLLAVWRPLVPFPYTGTSLVAFLLGALGWIPLNLLFRRKWAIRRTLSQSHDYLEQVLFKALDATKPISVTLKSGKVYIGFVSTLFDPSYDRKYITLVPLLSGYRDANTKALIVTTDYARVYEQLLDHPEDYPTLQQADFAIVLGVSEVLSLNLFDFQAYAAFNTPDLSSADR